MWDETLMMQEPASDPPNPLQEMENRLIVLAQQVKEMREAVIRLKAAARPRMPLGLWMRHHIKATLGLVPILGRLRFPGPPRILRIPKRYYRKPKLTNPPVISVVTPSFNQGLYLEQTIQSVLGQEYPRLQFVVQDGGSTDETAEILARYRDQFHHCEMRKDNGQSQAINLGFTHTSGEIMAYLNSDDLLLPGALFAVAKFFEEHPDVDVVYGHRVIINHYGEELGRWVLPPHDIEALKWADYVPQETLFCFAMDWDLLLRFQDAGATFHRLGRFLGAFRVHDTSKTVTVVNSTGLEEMEKLRRRCHSREVSPLEIHANLKRYLWRHAFCNRLYELGIFRY
jgi:glycosyltransferase involved in cell wall biosynthesis